ncbi:hypothetical protein PTKIN_Ptkin03bG0195800 [Pterospermum kingtungense]
MISNIYAEAGYWKDYEEVREMTKAKGLRKDAGRSWVEIDKEEMEMRMKQELGYVHGVKFALRHTDEESKEESLRVHSETLAIGWLYSMEAGVKQE